ncbi:hypothetical protein FSW04_10200 [Baekduia soli]|uniref:DUF3618 domain-containing protein n=1 Tax=Baekduia soli TaxID=496014 RepID=A0A5B8U493_9ACTN|nr:hypothetical protein [Baekduia soli]QEC47904.1 hypothetical protein FSW04_10200 [Baekduia soli]
MTQMDAGTGEQVREKAGAVAGQAQEKAQQAAGRLGDQARAQIDERSTDVGRRVGEQAADLRAVGDQLRQQGKDRPARLVDEAAHHVERAGGWLQESDADAILDDVEDAARKNPWAVVAGGVVLGLAASRFLKASSGDRYRTRGLGADVRRGALPAPAAAGPDQRFTRAAAPAAPTMADPPADSPQVPPPTGSGAL